MNSPNQGFSLDSLAQTIQSYQQQMQALQAAIRPQTPPQPEPVAGNQALLVQLYDEFVTTDEGKQLAAGLTRFARYVQSKVDKQNPA